MDLIDQRPRVPLSQAECRGDGGQDLGRVAQWGEIDENGASRE